MTIVSLLCACAVIVGAVVGYNTLKQLLMDAVGSSSADGDGDDDCKHEKFTLENAVAATCTEDGYSGDKTCLDCQKVIKGKTVKMLGHSFDDGVVTKEATCVSTGVLTSTCTRCLLETTSTIPQLDACNNEYHYESDSNHKMVCRYCHQSSNGAHTPGQLVESIGATCTEGAYAVYRCSDCDSDYKVYDAAHPALGHNWDEENPVTVAATCMSTGSTYWPCKNEGCQERGRDVTLPANPNIHTFEVQSTVGATCEAEGSQTLQCVHCQKLQTKVLPKVPHTYGTPEIDGNWTRQTCTVCDHKVATFSAKDSATATLNTADIDADKALKVELKDAQIEFPKDVVDAIKGNNNVTINADIVDKNTVLSGSNLSDEDKETLLADKANIYDFGVVGIDTGVFAKNVVVTLPYTLAEDEDPEGIVIWYLTNDGDVEAIDNVLFVDDDGDRVGEVIFEVSHFSHYAIAYRETPEMRCRRGIHDYGNSDRWTVVERSCTGHGYTLKVCSVCGNYTLTDITNPLEHEYGELTQPTVTCDRGGYVYRECAKCHGRENYEYIPSTGHTPVGVATCDTSVSCSVCKRVIVEAYGHSWSEWQVVVEATAESNGLKRRHCPRCGASETIKTNPLMNVEPWEYSSLSELLEAVFTEFVGVKNGEISIAWPMPEGENMTLEGLVNSTGDTYTAVLEMLDEERNVQGSLYYLDGQVIFFDGNEGKIQDIDQMMPYTFEQFLETMRLSFRESDDNVRTVFESVSSFVKILNAAYGEEINGVLAENGLEFTVDDLAEMIELQQTLYAYYVMKMGLDTSVLLPGDFDGNYINDILSKVMTAEEITDGFKYTYDAADLSKAVDSLIAYFEERQNTTCADYIYELIGDTVKVTYPSVTNFDGLVNLIRTEFPGNMQVANVIDKVSAAISQSGEYTIDDVYELIDAYAGSMGAHIDSKAQIQELAGMTMDQLAANMFNDETMTAAAMYDQLSQLLKETKVGDLAVDHRYEQVWNGEYFEEERVDITFSEKLVEVRAMFDALTVQGKVEITLTSTGKFTGVNFDVTCSMEGEDTTNTQTYKIVVKESDKTITLPDYIEELKKVSVDFTYDTDGNLIISGIPADVVPEIEIDGNATTKLSGLVKLDHELSDKMGFDVYVLERAYWEKTSHVGEYLVDKDGKLYALLENRIHVPAQIIAKETLNAVLAAPHDYLPTADTVPAGYYGEDAESGIPVYKTLVGYVYQEGGEWMLVDMSRSEYHRYWQNENEYVLEFVTIAGVPYMTAMNSVDISNFQTQWYDVVDTDGQTIIQVGELYVSMEGFTDNVALTVSICGDQMYIVDMAEDYSYTTYEVGDPLGDSVQYDKLYSHEKDDQVIYKDGQVTDAYAFAELYVYVPTYYAEYDGYYFDLGLDYMGGYVIGANPFGKVDVSGLNTMTLPDGRTLYVVRSEGSVDYEAEIYGYICVKDDLYVQTRVDYKDGVLTDIYYRESLDDYHNSASKYYYVHSDNLKGVLDRYVVKNSDGTYMVKAEGIAFIKSLCSLENDCLSIRVFGSATAGEKTARFEFVQPVAYVMPTHINGAMESPWFSWESYFDGDNSDETELYRCFYVTVNADGSVSITAKDGSYVDIEFDFDTNQNIDGKDFLSKNEELSNQYDLDIYSSVSTDKCYAEYVYFGGSYYVIDHSYKYYAEDYKSVTLKDLKNRYSIGSLYYQLDEVDPETGDLIGKVYRGKLYFENSRGSFHGLDCYFQMVDGKLYVLTGVSMEANTIIQYEGRLTVTEYIDSLTFTSTGGSRTELTFLNGTQVYYEDFSIYEGEIYYGSISYCYYLQGGQKTYVIIGDERTEISYDFHTSVTLPKGWVETDRHVEVSENRNLEIVSGFWYENHASNDFVRVGDKYIRLDDYFSRVKTEESFFESVADKTFVYGVDTGSGMEYYFTWSYDFSGASLVVLLSDPADINVFAKLVQGGNIGQDDQGRAVYECIGYSFDTTDVYTLSNGSVMYCGENTREGYVKLDNGTYLRGYLEENQDGSYEFNLYAEEYFDSVFSSDEIVGTLKLRDYITLNGTTVTIDAAILDALKMCEQYGDRVSVDSTNDWVSISFTEFISLFQK